MSLNRIENTILSERPVKVVFAYLSQLENMREWAGVKEIARAAPGRLRTGSEYNMTGRILLFKLHSTVTFTDYQLNKQFGLRSTMGPFSFYDRFVFEPMGGGTQVSQSTRVRARGMFRLLIPPLTWLMRPRITGDLYRAQELLEQGSED